MRVDAFDFELPDGLIAARPVEPRDAARLLVVDADGRTEHRVFRDLPELLRPGDVLAVNDTKVIPARLTGRTAKGKVEATLVAPAGEGLWIALARPARKLARGARIVFADDFSARAVETRGRDGVVLALDTGGARLLDLLERHGSMPLPPYIGRPEGPDAADRRDYQTVYAAEAGAVAAPTAGLHFTDALLDRLESAGIGRVRVTLHVGPGTFRPVRADDTDDHVMHAEWGRVTADAARRIDRARAAGGRVVAVGTTSARLLESATDASGRLRAFEGETDLFIVPGYRFRAVDLLATNFHLPRSTLFMLVCAFAGTAAAKNAYREAIREHYRFYSYGDACLLTAGRLSGR